MFLNLARIFSQKSFISSDVPTDELDVLVLIISAFCQVVLDSDAGVFGGFGRIHHTADHFTSVSHSSDVVACVISLVSNLN